VLLFVHCLIYKIHARFCGTFIILPQTLYIVKNFFQGFWLFIESLYGCRPCGQLI